MIGGQIFFLLVLRLPEPEKSGKTKETTILVREGESSSWSNGNTTSFKDCISEAACKKGAQEEATD